MAAVQKPVIFSWIPKGGGKGGQFSNATSHDSDTDTLAIVNQFIVNGGRWESQVADVLFASIPNSRFPRSLAVFNSFSSVNQQYYSFLMTSYAGGTPYVYGRGYVTAAGTFTSLDLDGAPTKGFNFNPVIFQTVKNRCYACDGTTQAQRPTDLNGPRIYSDSVGAGTSLTGVNWGLPTPVPNLQVSPDPNSFQTGTCTTNATTIVSAMSFDPRTNLAAGMPFYVETAAGSGQYYEYIIASCDSATQLTLTTAALTNYAGGKCQGNYGSLSWGPNNANYQTGTATTSASANVTVIAGFNAQTYAQPGYRLLIETAAGSGVWNTYTILTVPSSTSVTVTPNTVENYAGARIRLDLPATSSGISSDNSYLYAISYYDSARGHVGNPGPFFTVNWGAPFNKRINLLVQNITDAPSAAASGRANAWTYDKIILWRSASNGATLSSRVLLNPAGGGGTQSFTDNLSDDTQLGRVGPAGASISSRVTAHSPPPVDLNFATYWENRFFGSSTSNPGVLYWTAATQQEIDSYGIPEECWPPLNTLLIPESDGTITGIRTVGSSLIVMTQSNLYQVEYNTTNTTALFRLRRLSSKGSGTSHFATTVLPAEDAESGGDIFVHFGNDKRLYLLYGAGGDIPISFPIQDKLNTITAPANVRVGIRHDENATYIVLLPNQGTPLVTSLLPVFLYDLDRKIWLTQMSGQSCYTEGLFSGTTVGFLGAAFNGPSTSGQVPVGVYQMATSTAPWPNFAIGGTASNIKTQYVKPPGTARMDEKTLQAVILWGNTNTTSATWTVNVGIDERTTIALTKLNAGINPLLDIYCDTPDCTVYVPQQAAPVSGRTFQISIQQTNIAMPVFWINEIMAIWTVTVDEESTGGVV